MCHLIGGLSTPPASRCVARTRRGRVIVMPTLALHDLHEALGARFISRADWLVPAAYGDDAAEYAAVRGAVGLTDLSCRGTLGVSGQDRVAFLQGLLSNDMAKVTVTQGVYAALLTPQGRILTDLTVLHRPETLLLDVEPETTGTLFQFLTRYLLMSEARVEDDTVRWAHFSLQGPAAERLLRAVSGVALPRSEFGVCDATIHGVPVIVVSRSRTGEDGCDLLLAAAEGRQVWAALLKAGQAFGLRPYGHDAAEILRIEAGLPRCGVEMDDRTFPLEAGIEHQAVSFTKGCFVGQEPIARVHHRAHGRANRRLSGLAIEGARIPERGATILRDDVEAGTVMSAVASPALKRVVALGYVKREWFEPGTVLTVMIRGAPVAATVTALPFYQRPQARA